MKAGQLVALCFEARTHAHILHLTTDSYAGHKALNEFYDGIIPLADSYAETALSYVKPSELVFESELELAGSSAVETLESVRNWIATNRDDCGESSDLQNQIDEILALISQTLYKLTTLNASLRLKASK